MTEPVAYYREDSNGMRIYYDRIMLPELDNNDIKVKPLYDKNLLCPRVKMTNDEFDELKKLKSLNPTEDLITIFKIVSRFKYKNLQSRLVCSIENQTEFATLWLRGRYERLEELIEIVPTMKWFVRSKEEYRPDMDQGISESGYLYLTQGDIYSVEYHEMTTFKDEATQFNTEDEAKLWTTPDTEAVQLPVEED